jgi:hypothetical protein
MVLDIDNIKENTKKFEEIFCIQTKLKNINECCYAFNEQCWACQKQEWNIEKNKYEQYLLNCNDVCDLENRIKCGNDFIDKYTEINKNIKTHEENVNNWNKYNAYIKKLDENKEKLLNINVVEKIKENNEIEKKTLKISNFMQNNERWKEELKYLNDMKKMKNEIVAIEKHNFLNKKIDEMKNEKQEKEFNEKELNNIKKK